MHEAMHKGDIRIRRTHRALYGTMYAMLGRRNFNDITVNNLCAEALISRATFYSHFNDKYGLLKYLLDEIKDSIIKDVYKYDELEREINQFVSENKKLITNILENANSETLALVRDFMSSIVEMAVKRRTSNPASAHYKIFFSFIAGGLVNLLAWVVENDFPSDVSVMSAYLYKMLENLTIWDAEQENTAEINTILNEKGDKVWKA